MTQVAVYPGSFDPVTNGHLDIIQRGSTMVERMIVAIALNAVKVPMFTVVERVTMLEREIKALQDKGLIKCAIEVARFEGLLIDYAKSVNAKIILRGLRAMTDFDYEFQMTGMNRRLEPEIETIFLMASERNQFIASRMVKEIGVLGGDTREFVPSGVAATLKLRCAELAEKKK